MKTWEKIMLYPIGCCLWLADQAKKLGKFAERKSKPAIAMFLAVAVLLYVMPLTAFAMQIFIKVNVDTGAAYYTFEVEPTDRVEDLKVKIDDATGISWSEQILTFNGTVLEDGNTLQDYNIQKDSTVHLTRRHKVSVESEGAIAYYSAFGDALSAAASGAAVKLLDNVNESVEISKDITLDLNGKTINGGLVVADGKVNITSSSENGKIYSGSGKYALMVEGGSVSIGENVSVEWAGEAESYDIAGSIVVNGAGAKVTLDGAEVLCDVGFPVYVNRGEFTLNSGTVTCTSADYNGIRVGSDVGGIANLFGGTITSEGSGVEVFMEAELFVADTEIIHGSLGASFGYCRGNTKIGEIDLTGATGTEYSIKIDPDSTGLRLSDLKLGSRYEIVKAEYIDPNATDLFMKPGTTTIVSHIHDVQYAAQGDVIFETCAVCDHEATVELMLKPGAFLGYTGSRVSPFVIKYSPNWYGEIYTDIQYENNIDVGIATATLTIGGATVEKTFEITKSNVSYTAPTASNLVYNQNKQDLISTGSVDGGNMLYAIGTDFDTAPIDGWSTSVPQGEDAGTYYVWYQVAGDNNHTDVAPNCVAVTIAKKQIAKPAADSSAFVYNGGYQTYAINGDPAFIIDNNVQKNAGSYTVTVTLRDTANYQWTDGTTAVLEYTFEIGQKEIGISWDATAFLPYTGDSLVPQAFATNLVSGDTCTLTTEVVETTEGAGVIPGIWTAKVVALSNPNYKLPENGVRVTASFEIIDGYQNYAPDVSGVNETVDGKGDGKITGVDSTMEYRKEGETTYTPVSGSEITGLHDGVYFVRYAAKTYYNPSPEAQVTINVGRKLTVTVPQNQVGYTLTVDKAEFEYMGGPTITLIIHEGYSKTESFSVKLNGVDMQWGGFTEIGTQSCKEDIVITVEGIADITAPSAEISITESKWNSFWNGITFGLFFNEAKDVTISATDLGSGVNMIQYYLASSELALDEVKQIPVWQDYNGTFQVDPDNAYVVYAKITDNAGNVLYLNSDGIVLDKTAPTLVGIENGGDYYGDKRFKALDDYLDTLKVDGADVTDELNGDNEYKIVADNAEHIVTVTDKAGNVTEYKITVYKNYTVTYKADGVVVDTQTVGHGKDVNLPDVPVKDGYAGVWDHDGKNITADTTVTAVYTSNSYTVSFNANGGSAIDSITVTYGEKYGRLPSSSITGLSGGDSNWYLVDESGTVTDTKITRLSVVAQARNHTLFIKRAVLAPNVKLTLAVPGGISDSYNYYIPGNSMRILTASVNNANSDILNYSYQWYKNGVLIEGESGATLTLAGNVADAGTYKVVVTATLKDGTGITVTSNTAAGEKEMRVKILHAANELKYDANGGEGGPSANYTGGTTATVSSDAPNREHYVFQGWNTAADGSGDAYAAGAAYTFVNDGGNGGCVATLYAQWKLETKTVTYLVGNEVFKTESVDYGTDAVLPDIPAKEGYSGEWDHDGKNITVDTVINAVYTINKYTVTFTADGKVLGNVEVEHGKDVEMPATPAKDGYTAKWDHDGKCITADTTIRVVYTPIPTTPETGDTFDLGLRATVMAFSAVALAVLLIGQKKRKTQL